MAKEVKLRRKKILCIGIIGICFLFFTQYSTHVYAMEESTSTEQEELLEEYYHTFTNESELDRLEEELSGINQNYGKENSISFTDIFEQLIKGNIDEVIQSVVSGIVQNLSVEVSQNKEVILKLIALVIVAAIFNNYSSIIKFSYVGEQGFYITYLIIAVLLMQSFTIAYDLTEETMCYIRDIMYCLLPSFYMSLLMCGGITTSHMVNTMFVWVLSVIEKLMLVVVLPGIRIYFLIIVLNQINEQDRFSKLAGLIKQGIQFLLKAVVTGIIGLNLMKSILIPIYDNTKYNLLQKGLSIIPGGSSLSGLSTILVGAGVLIKNSVGIAVVIILLIVSSIPILKLFYFYVIYKIILALMQPISDNRVLSGIQGTADSLGILLRAMTTSISVLMLSIAIVMLTTNVRLYSG